MKGFAELTIVGTITSEPDYKVLSGKVETTLLKFSMAGHNRRASRDHDATTWITCIMWGKQADSLVDYMHKGLNIWVRGFPRIRPWVGEDGKARAELELSVSEMQFLGEGSGGKGAQDETDGQED